MTSVGTTSGHDVEKKCSLLGKFISDTDDRDVYTEKVKKNLASHLSSAEKVRLKVGRNSLTITDRTIWHNKLDRIPISLITDCHVDHESPTLCYFVNESINGRFQVLVFLCKTKEDSLKLVNNCPCRAKLTDWYTYSSAVRPHHRPITEYDGFMTNSTPGKRSPLPDEWNSNPIYHHSNGLSLGSPGNSEHVGNSSNRRGKKHTVNFKTTVQQYDSDTYMSKGRGTLQRNDDGVARIVIGGNERFEDSSREGNNYSSGLTIIGSNQNTMERKRHGYHTVEGYQANDGSSRRLRQSVSPARQSGDGSLMPSSNLEVLKPVSFPARIKHAGAMNELSPRRPVNGVHNPHWQQLPTGKQLHDQTNVEQRDGYGSQKRRKGQYKSIQEYEASQLSGDRKAPSPNLMPVSGSENISPRPRQGLALVLNGDRYMIQSTKETTSTQGLPLPQKAWPVDHGRTTPNGIQLAKQGRFASSSELKVRERAKSPDEGRMVISANQMDIQPQQLTNQLRAYTGNQSHDPKYSIQNFGNGDNFLRNEKLEVDDDHKFYRQHGQRVKQTEDGNQKLFLDQRLAETNDVIGNQIVQGQHAQKIHSGETVGANHRSRFHSEMRVSHQISKPAGPNASTANQATTPMLTGETPSGMLTQHPHGIGRQNSRPVKVINHQWPPMSHFNQDPVSGLPRMHFNEAMPGFEMGHSGMQRFFQPPLNPYPQVHMMNSNPGFQRFFESIKNFGPHQSANPITEIPHNEAENVPLAIENSKQATPIVESPSDNISESSSIRSSASAYWPPELKFQMSEEDGANSWKFHKPMMMLRRKSPNEGLQRHQQLRIIN